MTLIPFSAFHANLMRLPPKRAAEVLASLDKLEALGQSGLAYTILDDADNALGLAGVVPLCDGVGEVFAVMADCPGSRKNFVKGVKWLLECSRKRFATIQALGDADNPMIDRWLSWLGFKKVSGETDANHTLLWRLA